MNQERPETYIRGETCSILVYLELPNHVNHYNSRRNITIYSDVKSARQALVSNKLVSQLTYRMQSSVAKTIISGNVSLKWVPNRSNVDDNKIADRVVR